MIGPPDDQAVAMFTVSGVITDTPDRHHVAVTAHAVGRRPGADVVLGEAPVDDQGRYTIGYEPTAVLALHVEARDADGTVLARSPYLLSPGGAETVDLVLPPPDHGSEFAAALAAVEPHLAGTALAGLATDATDPDVVLVATLAGWDPADVARLALAHHYAAATGLPPAVFYGLLRAGTPADLAEMAVHPAPNLWSALRKAGAAGQIPPMSDDEITEAVDRLRAREADHLVDPPSGGMPEPLAALLRLALPEPAARARAAGELVAETPADPSDRLALTLRLGELTDNDVALVARLLERFDDGTLTDVADLAGWREDDWAALLTGPDLHERARRIHDRAVLVDPTRQAARRLADDPASRHSPAARYLREHPAFDLQSTVLNPADFPGDDGRTLLEELRAMQRVFRIAPDVDAMQQLRAHGIRSALEVARVDRASFVARFTPQLGEAEAGAIHERAAQAHATAAQLVAEHHAFNQLGVAALREGSGQHPDIPDWSMLFGSPDYCACAECRSVLGLAAYLADLLHFLDDRQSATGTPVLTTLLRRRPDLEWIELSCANSTLELPYVDLVNELLERAVDPSIIDWSTIDADHPPTAAQRVTLQTTGTPAALRAAPQHVTPGAYDTLRAAPFPWTLPFDLWGVETRTWLGHLGVRRHELMATFAAAVVPLEVATEYLGLAPLQRRIITEPPAAPFSTPECYGFPASTPDLPAELPTVRRLLDVTGLAYAELVELLRMRFVNPTGALRTESTDADDPDTCDTTRLRVAGMDTPALDRLHRFVRLRRALDWPASRLDRTLTAFGGRLDGSMIRMLATLRLLATRTGLAVERLLPLWAPVDTADRYPDDPCLYDQVFLDPARVAGATTPLRLNAARNDLATPADRREPAVGAALQGALGVSHDELTVLLAGETAIVAGDGLHLADLSALLRTVTLARAVGRPIPELLALIDLAGAADAPFPLPDEAPGPEVVDRARRFVERSDAIADSGLGVAQVSASLIGADESAIVLPDDTVLGRTLADLRAALRPVLDQTAATTDDETGTIVRRQLALLGWSATLVEDALGTLRGNTVYTAELAALPGGVTFPPELLTVIRYDGTTLTFAGAMTAAQHDALTQLSADAAYTSAVGRLHAAPRHFVTTRMGAFTVPLVEVPLGRLPAGVIVPPDLAATVFHDGNRSRLCARGFLGQTELQRLRELSSDADFQQAVDALAQAQETVEPAGGDTFLTAADAAALFDDPRPVTERFASVLRAAQPHLWRTLAAAVVEQKLSEAVGLPVPAVDALVGTWLRQDPDGPPLLDDFLDLAFVAGDSSVTPTRAVAGRQLAALTLLHRVALLVTALRIDAGQLPWILGRAGAAGWLDLADLPAPGAAQQPPLPELLRLLDLVRVRDRIPGGARTLGDLFALADAPQATGEQVRALLVDRTGWNAADLAYLCGPQGLQLTLPAGLGDERALDRLLRCFTLLRQLGVSAVLATGWVGPTMEAPQAEAARQAAKAHYDERAWASVAGPLRDELRDRQRAALVAHLVAHPLSTDRGPAWADAHELYQYYLVDVEMSPCRTTSRIVLATHSIQLYVQRCLLNLEPDVPVRRVEGAEYDPWSEWEWMGRYRVWQANRRTFLYPENFVRPELRLEKSPFFVELENTLKQSDVTDEAVEAVFRTYLERLDTVARLQPCGMYREVRRNDRDEVIFDLLHAFARTWVTPHLYYYRQLRDGIAWTPWEPVDLDIQGDHVIPVTWKGRLFLFWPLFVRTADEEPIKMPQPDQVLKDPQRNWATQFAWSERKNGKWLPKQLITENMSTPVGDSRDTVGNFLFRADSEFDPASNLTLSCYKKPAGGAITAQRGSVVLSTSKAVRTTDPRGSVALGAPPLGTAYVGLEYVEQATDGALGHPLMIATDPLATQRQHLLLARTPGVVPFRVLYPNHYDDYPTRPFIAGDPTAAFFFVDGTRSYFVVPDPTATGPQPDPVPGPPPAVPIRFTNFYHPFVEMLVGKLGAGGVAAMLDREVQTKPSEAAGAPEPFDFVATYGPQLPRNVHPATEAIDFGFLDGYSLYNWELFFHIPLMLAQRLTTNQRFAEAQRWFHTIFNPTDRSAYEAPQRFWQTRPFFETTREEYRRQQIEEVLEQLAAKDPPTELVALVRQWRQNPFQPDLIARLRTTAYQKAVVMSYLDLLLAWADQLFRQNSGESTTQATQLYVLAAEILGRRPDEVTPQRTPAPLTYAELAAIRIDPFANALIGAEHLVPVQPVVGTPPPPPPHGLPAMLYFGIPRNDKLLGYWDVVADRLGKIRHCLTIDGAVAPQSLTEPPLKPMALVAAVAGGQDVTSALADVDAPLPCYRFATLAAKAGELAGELRALSAGLLAALEKRDAERMARLRSDQEIRVLTAAREVRRHQVDEAQAALTALQRSRETAVARQQYYASRPFMNDGETAHVNLASVALDLQESASAIDMTANILGLVPDFKLGSPTTIGATFGGTFLVQALRAFSSSLGSQAGLATGRGALSATLAGFRRRADDWQFQADQAAHEITGLDQQIAAATVRLDVARAELSNHDLQTANARDTDAFLHSKYTAQELYDWTVEQLSTLYFTTYQLAYDIAKRAEQAYRFELGVATSNFVRFGYWDSMHKGLLAGERLATDLKRMEASYLELHQREYELTKRISLAATDPLALVALRRTGECFVSLPEALFDLDAPGHYHRRIRSVGFSLPCVTGPFTAVNCTATLLRSSIRTSPALANGRYARSPDDPRFRDYTGSVQTVVTSTGVEDTGLFEPNLRDERYLPFEGAGVIGDWHLRLPAAFRQFDYETLSDVVMHVRYTSREGGRLLADAVDDGLRAAVNAVVPADGGIGLAQVISARNDLPDAWSRFLRPLGDAEAPAVLTVPLSDVWIPFPFRHRTITVTGVQLLLPLADADAVEAYAAGTPLRVTLAGPSGAPSHTDAMRVAPGFLAGTPLVDAEVTTELGSDRAVWTVTATRADIGAIADELTTADRLLRPNGVRDLLVVLRYTIA